MRRFREMATETAGFYNTVGFNDDTRAFPRSRPATTWPAASTAPISPNRRRASAASEEEAHEVAHGSSLYGLAKEAYRL